MKPRRLALLALVGAVLLAHLVLLPSAWPPRLGEGAADKATAPARLQVSFTRELQPTAMPPPTRALLAPPRRAVAALPALPALAEAPLELPAPEPAASVPASALVEVPQPQAGLTAPLAIPVPPPPSGPDATTFDWPPSTRLSYAVSGDVRGPVEGEARVEWLRQGLRYQVHLELRVALLAFRRVSSDGLITPGGLSPRRYDEETRVAWRDAQQLRVELGEDEVVLAQGQRLPRPPGVQDSASQFVQMTWLFNARPELLQPGQSVAFPLALPRRIEPWVYDIGERETITTPAGAVEAVHVKPQREAGRGDLTAEFWVAPSLQHLPVRMLIRQGPALRLELLLQRWPEQAAPGR
jgi:hypothetical protein